MISFGLGDLGGVVVGPESDLEAGLTAIGDADCEEERVVLVRAFDGSAERP
jgi:hypothetical protein